MARPRLHLDNPLICYGCRPPAPEGGEIVAAKTNVTYTVKVSSSENVYDEKQLLRSVYESLYSIMCDTDAKSPEPIPEEPLKGDSQT